MINCYQWLSDSFRKGKERKVDLYSAYRQYSTTKR